MAHRAADSLAAPQGPRIGGRGLSITGESRAGTTAEGVAPAPSAAASSPPSQQISPSLSSLHMRGGLGKTLLIAFLLLAIVPLSFLAFVTYHQVQRDIRQRLLTSLETIASLQEAHLVDWVEANGRDLALISAALDRSILAPRGEGATRDSPAMAAVQAELEAQLPALQPNYSALVLVDGATGQVLAATDAGLPGRPTGHGVEPGGRIDPRLLGSGLVITPLTCERDDPLHAPTPASAAVRYPWDGKLLLGLLNWEALREVIAGPGLAVEGLQIYLVTPEGLVLDASGAALQVAALPDEAAAGPGRAAGTSEGHGVQALLGKVSGAGAYQDLQGVPVFGAYRWVPALDVGILAEQAQARFLSDGETLTALIVGATLAVALLTAAIAAVVTRRITRPIVQLTATASWMARGDLSYRVAVTRRDEIGVLAGAFNRMAADLQILYANLEARVAERTAQLADANEQARYHARQLAISAEVARVASSIRDLPALLDTVVELIGRSFELDQVSIYLLCREVSSPTDPVPTGLGRYCSRVDGQGARLALWQAQVTGHLTLHGATVASVPASVQAALAGGEPGLTREPGVASRQGGGTAGPEGRTPAPGSSPAGRPEMAVPLQVCGRTLGVLHVTGGSSLAFEESDQVIYRSLADQIAIAIENASAYALEHETVRHLRELDRIQSRFLTNMSHALRTPLNSIIGFSRVMLKGLDGSLNELQRSDLATIHEGGRQLLGLIDDLLELSQWDIAPFAADQVLPLGESEDQALNEEVPVLSEQALGLSEGQVDLAEIVEGVMATARALARGTPVQLCHQVPGDLPRITTDGRLVRRLVLALLANAVKFTSEGQIRLVVSAFPDSVCITVGVRPGTEPAVAVTTPTGALECGQAPACQGSGEQESSAHSWLRQPQVVIAQRIVERLGGQIRAGSPRPEGLDPQGGQEEGGTAFAFTLPIAAKKATGLSSSSTEEAQ